MDVSGGAGVVSNGAVGTGLEADGLQRARGGACELNPTLAA